jgi:hypothetical protein
LAAKVAAFDKMFNGGFKEAAEKCAYLPADDPEAFAGLSHWIYHGELATPATSKDINILSVIQGYVKTFCLAEKYCIVELMDHAMDRIFRHNVRPSQFLASSIIAHAYNHSSSNSVLRLYMCRFLYAAINNSTYSLLPGRLGDITDLIRKTEGICRDLVVLMAGSPGLSSKEIMSLPSCEYHHHYKADKKLCGKTFINERSPPLLNRSESSIALEREIQHIRMVLETTPT